MKFINDVGVISKGGQCLNFYDLSKEEIIVDIDGCADCRFTRDQFRDLLKLLCEIMGIEE